MRRLVLPTLSGVLYFLSWIGFGIWPLAFVCFVPLLWALRDATPRRALWVGAWMGFVTHLGGYTWIMHVLQVFANAPLPLAFAGYLVLCAVQGLLFGVMSYVLVWVGRRTRWPAAALLPIALVATEFGYPLLFQSYTGIALMPVLPLVQIAELGGVLILSALQAAVNRALVDAPAAARRFGRPRDHGRSPRRGDHRRRPRGRPQGLEQRPGDRRSRPDRRPLRQDPAPRLRRVHPRGRMVSRAVRVVAALQPAGARPEHGAAPVEVLAVCDLHLLRGHPFGHRAVDHGGPRRRARARDGQLDQRLLVRRRPRAGAAPHACGGAQHRAPALAAAGDQHWHHRLRGRDGARGAADRPQPAGSGARRGPHVAGHHAVPGARRLARLGGPRDHRGCGRAGSSASRGSAPW